MSHFMDMIARAGRSFVAAKGKDTSIEGAPLAEWLRSGAEIGAYERECLAELVTGEWRSPTGRKEVTAGQKVVVEVVKELRRRVSSGEKKEAAKLAVASQFGISRATVENYEKMTLERDQAHADGQKLFNSLNPLNK